MKRLKLKDKYYKIIDGFDINESSREVKYSNVKIDFTNKSIADLPLKYQECQLIDGDVIEKKASEGETIEGSSLNIDYDKDRNYEYNFKGQIEQDGTPTPDSPVPVETTTGRQVVRVCGKNLFDKNKADVVTGYINSSTGELVLGGTSKVTRTYIPILPNTNMNISGFNNIVLAFYNQDKTFIERVLTGSNSYTFNKNAYYIRIQGIGDNFNADTIQLEKGSSSTTYEEYKGNDYEINLGKNLFGGFTFSHSNNGITFTYNQDGSITCVGTSTGDAFSMFTSESANYQITLEAGTYTLSGGTSDLLAQVVNSSGGLVVATTSSVFERTFTISQSTKVYVRVGITGGKTINTIAKPMLEKGTGTSYSPYKTPIYLGENDYIKQSTGKNLLENKIITQTINGITFTKNDDGSITINGTASGGNAYLNLYDQYESLVKDTTKTYTFSISATTDDIELIIGEKSPGSSAILVMARGNAPSITYTPSGLREGQVFRIGVKNTKTINNLTIYPQVEEGELSDYEPYGKGIWYYKNNWGRVVLNGSETYSLNTEGFTITQSNWNNLTNNNCMSKSILLSNYYKNYTTYADLVAQNYGIGIIYSGAKNLYIRNTDITSVANLKTWLASNNVEVYYMLANPKYTIIEDTELLEQLSSIKLLSGINNISITSTNLPLIMNLHYNFNEDIEIVTENEVIYTGYVNNYTLPKMKNKLEYRELDIDLLSPLALATLRTADAIGTYNLQTLIREIIQPLIDDGFTLKELNVGNNQISVNYLTETVESALNKLSNKFNFWWFIDKNKNIYINDIKYIFNKKEKAIYDDNNKINGLIDFTPSMESVDYFNTIDFTNVRLVTKSHYQKDQTTTSGITNISYLTYNPLISKDYINPGDEIEFEIPFIINTDKRGYSNTSANVEQGYFRLYKIVSEGTIDEVVSLRSDINNEVIIPSNATITDNYNEDKEFVFVKDSFFDNLIVGMKYNGSSKINVGLMVSDTALMWTKVRINDNREIEFNKDIISTSGIVEKQIDMNEQWLTYEELLEISNSLIGNNNVNVEKVEILTDVENNYNVGDIISINKPSFLTHGDFIITDKKRSYYDNVDQWTFTLNNTNILESYIDLFRSGEQEEQSNKVYNLITGDYAREIILEKYEVEVL